MTDRVSATVVHDGGEEEIERSLRPGSLVEFEETEDGFFVRRVDRAPGDAR